MDHYCRPVKTKEEHDVASEIWDVVTRARILAVEEPLSPSLNLDQEEQREKDFEEVQYKIDREQTKPVSSLGLTLGPYAGEDCW